MAIEVWLLRHAEAVPHASRPDSDRELTPRGERQARAAGSGLARLALEFDACYTSPKVRARETARLACEDLGVNFELVSSLSAGFDLTDCRELLHRHDDGERVLLVGHEPDFSRLIGDVTGGRVALGKGGAAGLSIDGSRAELFALLGARELESIGG